MSKVLIIGNVLKDVYLKLDEQKNNFELDEQNIAWLNLGFNGAAHPFYRRTSVYGGAAVSLAVLSRLGIDAKIMGSQTEFKNGELVWKDEPSDYRYIFCHEGEIAYFVPGTRKATDWTMPSGTPEWILVDRSALISPKLVDEIKNFIKFSPATKLAVHAEKRMTPSGKKLTEMADVLFLEDEPPVHHEDKIVDKIVHKKSREQLICHIGPQRIVFNDAEEAWRLSRTDMLTHLTVYSTIVATVLGVLSVGGSAEDAILWARLNAEQATLETSLSARKLKELAEAEKEKRLNVKLVAKSLMAPRHGILALDESDPALTERLISFGIPATDNTRKAYREMVLMTPELRDYASGVILTEQIAREKNKNGESMIDMLISRGIIPGIKADLGQAPLDNSEETYTVGIDGLTKRLRRFYDMGARFAKWHAKFEIGKNTPGFVAIETATVQLAAFAKECQLAGLVPVVESDVIWSGDYDIERNMEVTHRVLSALFDKLERRGVDLSSVIIKTNMVSAGKDAVAASSPEDIGMATAGIIAHAIPKFAAGVLMLSGGQEANSVTKNLAAIVKNGPFPWPVSFAFGRALTDPVMQTWKGKKENIKSAQGALKRHLQENTAVLGK